jgi:vacuolar-type H+-ATPase subunit E/Vma4
MEMVRNGELLEAQILEDARAKARRIAEAADRECASIRAEGAARLAEEAKRLDEAREARVERLRRELAASLPLDFRRARLAFLQEALDAAVAAWLRALRPADTAAVVKARMAQSAAAFEGRRVHVRRAGLDAEQAREIVAAALPKAVVETVTELTGEEAVRAGTGLVVECVDGSRRLRATFAEITAQLMDEHRGDLAAALFGKDVNA